MAEHSTTVVSTWPREQTFDYLADYRNLAAWYPSISTVRLSSGQPGEQGAVYEVTLSALGKQFTVSCTAVKVDRPRLTRMSARSGAVSVTDTVEVDADSRVTHRTTVDLHGRKRLAEPMARAALGRAAEQARQHLAAVLTGPAGQT